MNTSAAGPPSYARSILGGCRILLARTRFLLLVGGFLAIIAAWPYARNHWDRLSRTAPAAAAVSPDTEYWCPMCPGVISEWPSKCPVCSMALIRRQKGEMTPLPDGVVARVQLSPYRVQLAGIRTAPVEYRPIDFEVTVGGLLAVPTGSQIPASSLMLTGEVFERNAAMLVVGQGARVASDGSTGETFSARIDELTPATNPSAGWRVRMRVDHGGELRAGQYAVATFRIPAARLELARRVESDRWRDGLVAGVMADPWAAGSLGALYDAGVRQAFVRAGMVLCVPEMAVVDTGTRKVVFVETMAGVYDAVEVRLGRRCGDFYPVWSGIEPGQSVATAGAVLLDAETRLNPSVAAGYFGSGRRTPAAVVTPAVSSPDDKLLIARQKICPVTEASLDSMGGPVRLEVEGRIVFICCKACEKAVRQKSSLYLPKLPK